ncbi:hypothetical protein KCV87_14980 [Actinosynnema pretiosum subsp. pretiosum]|uniref:Uncharacterized protein n=1 Tax=Actinosynnema pretiosum subsp. pretiosum TaxID=103721 RepID=A0AA45LBY5_9PSEU|nr:hypothetical protein APASM_1063 [Actinosynnema pretiosum subsp. pretiosum]QUF07222.1 hypothetical protein KCV87_14980 [Actinosynnema pretiosum subsp. pretiosum]
MHNNAVLPIGLYPSAVDYSTRPGLDEAGLTARIIAGRAALRNAGFDFTSWQVPDSPEKTVDALRQRVHPLPQD